MQTKYPIFIPPKGRSTSSIKTTTLRADFCIFILTHGRPDHVITYNTLVKANCSYPIYIVVDNEDSTIDKYKENFGEDRVIVFDKLAISKKIDEADNFSDRRAIVYARNACFDIAENLGYTYFLELDDDYTQFIFTFDKEFQYDTKCKKITRIDPIIESLLEFYTNIPAKSIAIAQGGDFIGGDQSAMWKEKVRRKCMNSFFCSVERRFQFLGRINEDVNVYTYLGSTGNLFLTIGLLRLKQLQTQSNKSGMSDIYLSQGTYIKSFYTILFSPSCTTIRLMGEINNRLHHHIMWNNAVPKILSEEYRK